MGPERRDLTAVVINLVSRPDRLASFTARWNAANTGRPFHVQPAVAHTNGAIGCLASHLAVLQDHPGPLLVLEDDAVFADNFTLDLPAPPDWQVLWLGGQHRMPPHVYDDTWFRPRYFVRTHAYIVREPAALAARFRAGGWARIDPFLAQIPVAQYALRVHTVGQSAGRSDIDQQLRERDQYWTWPHRWFSQPITQKNIYANR